MAAVPSSAFWAAFLPVARASIAPGALSRLPAIIPAAVVTIPNLIDTIWEGILKAVPKKKTSYARKRQRQLAPEKRLKDITFVVKCSSCGRPKKAHILCPYCVASVKKWFRTKLGASEAMFEERKELPSKLKPELRLIGKKRLEEYPKMMAQQGDKIQAAVQRAAERKEQQPAGDARGSV